MAENENIPEVPAAAPEAVKPPSESRVGRGGFGGRGGQGGRGGGRGRRPSDVGENAFAHEAGIHQDGYLKNPSTYEIISPASVGVPETRLVLGKHSGRRALEHRLKELGHDLTREELNAVYERFTDLADRKKVIYDQDILGLLNREVMSA